MSRLNMGRLWKCVEVSKIGAAELSGITQDAGWNTAEEEIKAFDADVRNAIAHADYTLVPVSKDGKPLAGAAKASFVNLRHRLADMDWVDLSDGWLHDLDVALLPGRFGRRGDRCGIGARRSRN